MKFVNSLDNNLIEYLNKLIKTSSVYRLRIRAHAIMLSYKKYSIDSIADIFDVHRDTISRWLDSWYENGVTGLYDAPKPGRPRKIKSDVEVPKVRNYKSLARLKRLHKL
jgi:transposase